MAMLEKFAHSVTAPVNKGYTWSLSLGNVPAGATKLNYVVLQSYFSALYNSGQNASYNIKVGGTSIKTGTFSLPDGRGGLITNEGVITCGNTVIPGMSVIVELTIPDFTHAVSWHSLDGLGVFDNENYVQKYQHYCENTMWASNAAAHLSTGVVTINATGTLKWVRIGLRFSSLDSQTVSFTYILKRNGNVIVNNYYNKIANDELTPTPIGCNVGINANDQLQLFIDSSAYTHVGMSLMAGMVLLLQ